MYIICILLHLFIIIIIIIPEISYLYVDSHQNILPAIENMDIPLTDKCKNSKCKCWYKKSNASLTVNSADVHF